MEQYKYKCNKEGECLLQKGRRKRIGYKCVESNCKHLVKTELKEEFPLRFEI